MSDLKNPIDALKKWSSETDKRWLKTIIDTILCVKRELTDEEIQNIYCGFLKENNLAEEKQGSVDEKKPASLQQVAKSEQEIKKVILKSVSEIEKVNALTPGQEILFHPKLTVIFGYNAAGKSGYVRIFKRVSKSRTSEDIWTNVHLEKGKNVGKAKFILEIEDTQKKVSWNGESEIPELSFIDVFDNKCVKVFLTDDLTFGFRPYGFELFSVISIAINRMKELLQQDISLRDKEIDFSPDFNEGTTVFQKIKTLSAKTVISDIDAAAQFTDKDLEDLREKDNKKNSLLVANTSDKIKVITSDKTNLEKIESIFEEITKFLSDLKLKEYADLSKEYLAAKKKVEDKKTTDLTEFTIPLQGTKEWDALIRSAEEYIRKLPDSEKYPGTDCECIYCRQKLSEQAIKLIKCYRDLLNSKEEDSLKEKQKQIDEFAKNLRDKKFSIEQVQDSDNILNRIETDLFIKVKAYCDTAEELRSNLVDAFNQKDKVECSFEVNDGFAEKIKNAIVKQGEILEELKKGENERKSKVGLLDKEIKELTDRKVLSEKKNKIIEYLNDLKWVNIAKDLARITTTKPVTDLSKKVWETVITDEFKTAFEEERKSLKAPSIEFVFPGEQGVQKRSKSLAGMKNIDDFLSEGEQKAIALADFLAELRLKKISTPVVFDDPVTSFDHVRRRAIAERLFNESSRRQVVIFTHDILFLSYLSEYCKEDESSAYIHWIEQCDDGLSGKVNLNDCPLLDKYSMHIKRTEGSIQRVKTLSGSAKEAEIMNGFSSLRCAYESFVIEKIFKKTIERWNDRIRMNELKNIVYDDQLMAKVQNKFEELSRYIEAHTHSNVIRQDAPDGNKLEQELKELKGAEKELKDKQKTKMGAGTK